MTVEITPHASVVEHFDRLEARGMTATPAGGQECTPTAALAVLLHRLAQGPEFADVVMQPRQGTAFHLKLERRKGVAVFNR